MPLVEQPGSVPQVEQLGSVPLVEQPGSVQVVEQAWQVCCQMPSRLTPPSNVRMYSKLILNKVMFPPLKRVEATYDVRIEYVQQLIQESCY